MNKTGYDNPKHQKARYERSMVSANLSKAVGMGTINSNLGYSKNSAIINDQSKCFTKNSCGEKLHNMSKVERMFG